jgi:hypothetical protein
MPEARRPHPVIHLHLQAPAKPAPGAACNGCGLCCLAEPCPMGMLISRRRHGACSALQWSEAEGRYHCGVVADPTRHLRWLPRRWARALALRWIASGVGCDADLEVLAPIG